MDRLRPAPTLRCGGVALCVLGAMLCLGGGLRAQQAEPDWAARRERMVQRSLIAAGIRDGEVLRAMRSVPRHAFVPAAVRDKAYLDAALPIGSGQTISSPYIVARMTQQLAVQPTDRVLEIGTGSGYQAAILSHLAKQVFSIEIVPELGRRAARTLKALKRENVAVRVGDGYQGWTEHAPFDKIIVTCSPQDVPQPLVQQLAEGGRLVVPLGQRFQQVLYRFTKRDGKLVRERVETTFFVPMTGQAQKERLGDKTKNLTLANGSFEASQGLDVAGWYYLRGGRVARDTTSPDGKQCLLFRSGESPECHALQPFGVDGRRTASITVRFWARQDNVRYGLVPIQTSQLIVEFYDEARRRVGEGDVSIQQGTAAWRQVEAKMDVPQEARFAIVGVGLFGVSGEVAFDDVRLGVDKKR